MHNVRMRSRRWAGIFPAALAFAGWGGGSQAWGAAMDLTQLGIEDLMQLKVVSAAKVEQTLQDSAAAVFVITADDIRRSGATTLPEALQLAPGVEAARIDASRWSVTIRGFNGRFANKLLVLVDGRSIYTPLFSGVHWDVQGPPLDEIERIEVIRGPGGSLWGANAVHGVINIITKQPKDTQGGLFNVTVGDEERAIVGVRHGGSLGGGRAHYRVSGQFAERDGLTTADGRDAGDDWRLGKGGFRVDWTPSSADAVTVQGELYRADLDQNFVTASLTPPYAVHRLAPVKAAGGSLQARWEHAASPTSRLALQAYYQYEDRDDPLYVADLDTFDLDFQHSFAWGDRHDLVWGLGYRRNQDRFTDTAVSAVRPRRLTWDLFSAFAQDQIELIPDRLRLIGGVKLEHNDFSGLEWQPSLRALWTPHPDHRLWAAVSRAVRTPSRGEQDATRIDLLTVPPSPFTGNLPALISISGARRLDPETLVAYELGYRVRLTERLSADAVLFQHDYDRLLVGRPEEPVLVTAPGPPHLQIPIILANAGSGVKSGFELAADWRPTERWRLRLAYSYLDSDLNRDDNGDPTYTNGNRQQISLFSSWNPRDDWDVDLWWRYVDVNEVNVVTGVGLNQVKPYANLSVRLGWRPRKELEFALVGANLIDSHHLEFVQEAFAFPVEVERSFFGQVKWSF